MKTSLVRRTVAAAGILALGAIAAVGVALPAHAAPGNIDPNAPRSLTIHKYELSPTSPQQPGTGQAIPGGIPGGIPIENVVFTATLVPSVDLTTTAGWNTAGSLTPATAAPLATGMAYTATTNAAGTGAFPTTMPIGLYLVTETSSPATVTNPTAPFLVTLPFPTGPTGSPANDWVYDVHVYPKNAVTALTKTRVTPAAGSVEARNPDLVRWAIASSIPQLPSGGTIDQFVLTDQITTDLQFVTTPPTGVAPTGVTVTNSAGAMQTFATPADYAITTAGNTMTLTFTAAGRVRLATLGGGNVTLSVLTRAASVPANGTITNTATSAVNGATETVTGATPIGQLTVLAYAPTAGSGQTPLAGAQYQVFLTQADANAGTNPVSVNGVNTWTTGVNGQALIPVLTPDVYWVRETVPPGGFQLPAPAVVSTQVVAGLTSTSAPVQDYLTVPHSQVPAWALPLTGGDGALWFGVGGGALVVLAIGAALLVAHRRAVRARTTA
jgi:fimbrial isopeptide formation D2 family protein